MLATKDVVNCHGPQTCTVTSTFSSGFSAGFQWTSLNFTGITRSGGLVVTPMLAMQQYVLL